MFTSSFVPLLKQTNRLTSQLNQTPGLSTNYITKSLLIAPAVSTLLTPTPVFRNDCGTVQSS